MRNGLVLSAAALASVVSACAQGRGQAVALPDGPGRELVNVNCGTVPTG